MNPGPAPRPPIDRPRLNIPPNNMTTSFGQMNLNSPTSTSATPSANFGLFPNTSNPSLAHSKSFPSEDSRVTIIKEGYVRCKEEKFLATWNQRYLILREQRLEFLKNDAGKTVLAIPLSHITGVSRSEDTKMAFEIVRLANPKDYANKSALLSRDVPTKTITCEVKSDEDIYDWIDKIYERCPGMGGVSNPTNFNHRVHVDFDARTGGFVGLPVEWEKLLTASAITKEDYKKNPQAVLEVLQFYSEISMREQNPSYTSSSLYPRSNAQQSRSYANSGGFSNRSVAPPRPPPPPPQQRLDTGISRHYSESPSPSSTSSPVQSSGRSFESDRAYEQHQQLQRMKELSEYERRRVEEERARTRQRAEEQDRLELEAYNASLPKTRMPLAKQELGGYSSPDEGASRYKPARPAPQAPSTAARHQPHNQFTPMRPAPSAQSSSSTNHKPPRSPVPRTDERQVSEVRSRPNDPRAQAQGSRIPQHNGLKAGQHGQHQSSSRFPAPVQPVQPLNIANKQNGNNHVNHNNHNHNHNAYNNSSSKPAGVRQAEAALAAKKPEPKQKETRMSNMTESEVMDKLKTVVSRDNPNDSYSKQRKIGQGASGSVYVARIKEGATTPVARELYRQHGPRCQVAIKQMDLRSQPRKELIVNEIIVMKDSQHANIVNFLDSFLQEQSNELWVIMEFMEGGALTDIIDNNPAIEENQIATICAEVCSFFFFFFFFFWQMGLHSLETQSLTVISFDRLAKDWLIFIVNISFIGISRVIMSCLIGLDMLKSVSLATSTTPILYSSDAHF